MPLLDPTSASALKAELAASVDRYTAQPTPVPVPPAPTPVPPSPTPVPPSGNLIINADLSTAKSVADALTMAKITPYIGPNVDATKLSIANGGLYSSYPSGTNIVTNLMSNYPSVVTNHQIDADIRFDTNFSTDGGMGSAAAMALKLVLPGFTSPGGRITLDLTDFKQYQLSLYANDNTGIFLPEMNSFDPPMGSQRWTVADEWTSGAVYTYRVLAKYLSATSIRVEAWFAKKGQPLVMKLHAESQTTRGVVPSVNRAEIAGHYNQPRNFATGVTVLGVRVGTL